MKELIKGFKSGIKDVIKLQKDIFDEMGINIWHIALCNITVTILIISFNVHTIIVIIAIFYFIMAYAIALTETDTK